MNWTKEEIEVRMLDALDGNLSKEDLQKLRDYLLAFPELGSLDEVYPTLNNDDFAPFQNEYLLKEVPFNPSVYSNEEGPEMEKMAIAKFEGLLNEKEESDFDQALKVEPELQKEWHLVNQTRLQQNAHIYFPNPETLHKEVRLVSWRNYVTYAAAASVLFFLYLGWTSQSTKVQASNKSTVKKNPSQQIFQLEKTIPSPILTASKVKSTPRMMKHEETMSAEGRDCVIQEAYPENSNEIALSFPSQDQPTMAIEQSSANGFSHIKGSEKAVSQEIMGWKEFVVQKGNERLFGTPNPSTSERYATIANYVSKAVNIPISYEQTENEASEITYLRLGFISIERKRAKK